LLRTATLSLLSISKKPSECLANEEGKHVLINEGKKCFVRKKSIYSVLHWRTSAGKLRRLSLIIAHFQSSTSHGYFQGQGWLNKHRVG
jgi:hypothetical protein